MSVESRDIVERLEALQEWARGQMNGGPLADVVIREAIATIKGYRAVAGKAQGNPSNAFGEIRRQSRSGVGEGEVHPMRTEDHRSAAETPLTLSAAQGS